MMRPYIMPSNDILIWPYNFKEFIFLGENVSNIVNKIGQVDILGISCYMWNWRISLKLAEEVRRKNPNCMIFLGGPHVPDAIDENFFFLKNCSL